MPRLPQAASIARPEAKSAMVRASMLIMSANTHFTAQMPTKRLAADCVLTDEAGRLLVLDPA